jgi:hypothetical protein
MGSDFDRALDTTFIAKLAIEAAREGWSADSSRRDMRIMAMC